MNWRERGSASLLILTFALLLIGVSAIGALEIGRYQARRADIRKLEGFGLAAMARAGGVGDLACQSLIENLAITCEFGGDEIALRADGLPSIRVGWRPFEP